MHTSRITKLISNLDHDNPSKRRSAAEALAEGDERAVYPLIKALRDDNFGVQDAAMHSLMELKGEPTAYMVLPLLRENSFLRNTAIIILKEIGQEAVPLLKILLKDKDDDVRKFALDLIHDIGHCGYPEDIVRVLTEDTNANVRAAAAKALGVLHYEKALPRLINALKDDEWVCFSSLEALAHLKDNSSLKPITGLLDSPSEAIRFAAIETLGKIGSPAAEKPLTAHLSKANDFEKTAILISLVRIGRVPQLPGISDIFISMLEESEWEEKLIAVKGLVILREKSVIYKIADLAGSLDFSNPESEEKLTAIREAIKGFGCNKFLIDSIKDDSLKYRGKTLVIEAAGNLKCIKAVPPLLKLLKDEVTDLRRAAITALPQIDIEQAMEHLIEALNDSDGHVRKTAVIYLGTTGEMSVFEPLMKILHKEDYDDVIYELVSSLLNINDTLFWSRISEFNDNVREIASRHALSANPEAAC
jgi:HEAT repeat protein